MHIYLYRWVYINTRIQDISISTYIIECVKNRSCYQPGIFINFGETCTCITSGWEVFLTFSKQALLQWQTLNCTRQFHHMLLSLYWPQRVEYPKLSVTRYSPSLFCMLRSFCYVQYRYRKLNPSSLLCFFLYQVVFLCL